MDKNAHPGEPLPPDESAAAGAASTPDYGAEGARDLTGVTVAKRYRIEDEIGRGRTGVVCRARDEQQNRPVALKLIHRRLLARAEARQRFLQEIRSCLELAHPNIIPLFDAGEWDEGGQAFIAMELLEGDSLRKRMERRKREGRRMEWAPFAALMRQLFSAIEYAHSRQIIHRDLKPESIMVVRQAEGAQRAIIMDFGDATIASLCSKSDAAAVGTPFYIAPEQRDGAAQPDERADIYSLGVMAYELLTGQLPLGNFEPVRALRADLPEGVDAWLLQAMAPQPSERFATAARMRKFFNHIQPAAGGAAKGGHKSLEAEDFSDYHTPPAEARRAFGWLKFALISMAALALVAACVLVGQAYFNVKWLGGVGPGGSGKTAGPNSLAASSNTAQGASAGQSTGAAQTTSQSASVAGGTASSAVPPIAPPASTPAVRFQRNNLNIITDSQTRLQWLVGPDKNTNYTEALDLTKRVNLNNFDRAGWRMPTRSELKALYQKESDAHNLDPLFGATGWLVWAEPDERDATMAWRFDFNTGQEANGPRTAAENARLFCVRPFKASLPEGIGPDGARVSRPRAHF